MKMKIKNAKLLCPSSLSIPASGRKGKSYSPLSSMLIKLGFVRGKMFASEKVRKQKHLATSTPSYYTLSINPLSIFLCFLA
jgi:hypothetical protein